jgi:ABC-type bacteriocin/lantibiotic exporter with double-glycine peptidase domain
VDHDKLTLVLTGSFFGAVLLGWLLHWLFARLNTKSGPRSIKQTALLVERVQAAEDAKLVAEGRLQAVENDLTQRLAQMQAELDSAHVGLEEARDETEQIRDAYRKSLAVTER